MANSPVLDFKQVNNDIYMDPVTGDFVMVPSDSQHILDLLQSYPGWWKNAPSVGIGLSAKLKGKFNAATVEGFIKQGLEADGYQVGRPLVTINANGAATIKPNALRI